MSCDLAVAAHDVVIRHAAPRAGASRQQEPRSGSSHRRRPAREGDPPPERGDPGAESARVGLVNQVVPRKKLDSAVDVLARKLVEKLPECTRYTKQQLNFWRDFSWAMTIGHARTG